MMRPKPRSGTFNEVYGTKCDAFTKSSVHNGPQFIKDYSHLIPSKVPLQPYASNSGGPDHNKPRRRSARIATNRGKASNNKFQANQVKSEDMKDEVNMKMKTTRAGAMAGYGSDNKSFWTCRETPKDVCMSGDGGVCASRPTQKCQDQVHHNQGHHNHSHHNHSHNNHNHVKHQETDHNYHHKVHEDDDKDDESEEFFELIRRTVDQAVRKSTTELLNRNFRELNSKVDRLSCELKSTNDLLNKVQMELNSKIVHFGEENARRFDYLCMKFDYDKMFFQQQSMMAASTAAPSANMQRSSHGMIGKNSYDKPCATTYRTSSETNERKPAKINEGHKLSCNELNLSQKSSELSMREVMEQMQNYLRQTQINKVEAAIGGASKKLDMSKPVMLEKRGMDDAGDGHRAANSTPLNKQIIEHNEDSDELSLSSDDGMTPRANLLAYGGMAARIGGSFKESKMSAGCGDIK